MLIFKVLRQAEWEALARDGYTPGSPVDLSDGFIHFSAGPQLRETVARQFAGAADLVLVAVEAEGIDDALKWEPSRGGALFPHLYRPLFLADVRWHRPLPLGEAGHVFPPEATA